LANQFLLIFFTNVLFSTQAPTVHLAPSHPTFALLAFFAPPLLPISPNVPLVDIAL
jgi:hypothetical protein